jgi:hypothetical protein
MVLFVAALYRTAKAAKSAKQPLKNSAFLVLSTVIIFALSLSTFDFRQTFLAFRAEGQGYASWKWHDSVIMANLKKLPPEVAIYTNTPPAVYLVTGRASRVLPTPIDPVDNRPRGEYEQDVAQMRADLLTGKAVLALFDTSDIEDALGAGNIAQFTEGLSILEKTQGDVLYGK